MNSASIEAEAREVQRLIWRDRETLFPLGVPRPVTMLQPEIAARVLGIEYTYQDTLGRFGDQGGRFETAGMLDRERNIIGVSGRFGYEAQRFTGAHEIGHWRLHPGTRHHRDRPMSDITTSSSRPPIEREADYFAACFLVPAGLLEQEFQARFPCKAPLPLTDATAFHLAGESSHALLRAGPSSNLFGTAVARAVSFNGRRFKSLAEEFGVSIGAMAIRLREVQLIED